MTTIHLTTLIDAPVKRIFDLSRSVNLHKIANAHTHERIVSGVMNGLLEEGETVTWQAKHLFKERTFTSKVTSLMSPDFFIDEMIQGDFKSFVHEHHFKQIENGTLMIDLLKFESPYGWLGKLVNTYYLKKYFHNLLVHRNNVIKEYAESTKWKALLADKVQL